MNCSKIQFCYRFQKKFRNNQNIPQDKYEGTFKCIELCDASITACETWYEVSALLLKDYGTCEGDQHLNWKTHGFSTILDILMVIKEFLFKTKTLLSPLVISEKTSKLQRTNFDRRQNIIGQTS